MATGTVRTQVGHDDLIHDAQLDYYGLRLATCSSDRLVKIFNVVSNNGAAPKVEFSCDLLGHTGPVWEVAWANPRWGTLLASCSYDGSVIVHRQAENGAWEDAFRFNAKGSVNSIEWCPFEYGLALACASSDGHVYVLRCDATTGEWTCETSFLADKVGCNSVTWAPYGALGSLDESGQWVMRLATGGAEQNVKIFKCIMDQQNGPQWKVDDPEVLIHHKDWVRDVAWAPSIGLPYNLLASCSEDGSVCIWSQESEENTKWEMKELPNFKAPVWKVAWSVTGSLLAVSAGDSDVSLWKESLEEKRWMKISEVKDKASAPTAPASIPQQQQPQATQHVEQSQAPKSRGESLDKQIPTSAVSPRSKVDSVNAFERVEASAQPTAAPEEPTSEAKDDLHPRTTWEGVPEDTTATATNGDWSGENQQHAAETSAEPVSGEQDQHGAQYGEYPGDQQQYAYDPAQQQQWDYQGGEYAQQQGYSETGQYEQGYAANAEQYGGWEQPPQNQEGWEGATDQAQWGQQQQWEGQQYEAGGDWTQQQQGVAAAGWGAGAQSSEFGSAQQGGLAAPPVYAGSSQPPQQYAAQATPQQQPW